MVRAWIMDNDSSNQRLPHMTDPPQFVDLDGLIKIGVHYWKLDADNYEKEGLLQKIRDERGYKYSDCVTCCPDKLTGYDNKDHTKTMQLFVDEPVWTPINQPADDHPKRQEYLQSLRQAQTA